MNRKLILIRGIPGSGKSTLAKKMLTEIPNSVHFEADMYFTNASGEYYFDRTKLKAAHNWCFNEVCMYLTYTSATVIVSNTFIKLWEMNDYMRQAKELNSPIEVIHCTGNYESVHAVPRETIERMKESFEEYTNHV